jgi:hypothetical protein
MIAGFLFAALNVSKAAGSFSLPAANAAATRPKPTSANSSKSAKNTEGTNP